MDRNDIADMRTFAKDNDFGFSMCAIDKRFTQTSKKLFEPTFMKALFDFGVRVGKNPQDCLKPMAHTP
jgi:hypothetical protein